MRLALIRANASQTAMYRVAASKTTKLEPKIRARTAEESGVQIKYMPDATATINAMENVTEAILRSKVIRDSLGSAQSWAPQRIHDFFFLFVSFGWRAATYV